MVEMPQYDSLAEEVFDAISSHYKTWVAEHCGEDIYAYVIYAHPLVQFIRVSVMTEQGLQQVASDYKSKHGYSASLEQLAVDLRWSVADSPYCSEHCDIFDSVNERLNDMMSFVDSLELGDPAFSTHIDTLHSILVAALHRFRQDVLSGSCRPMLYVDFGDMSDEERLSFIERCNDSEMVKWYCTSIAMAQ